MNTSKISISNFFIFKRGIPLLIGISLGPLIAGFLGSKIPFLIAALPETFKTYDLFYKSLLDLGTFFIFIYINRMIYQLFINVYVRELIARTREICFRHWLFSFDIYDEKLKNQKNEFPQGEILARIINDTEAFRELITSGAFGIFIDFIFVMTSLFAFIKINKISGLFLGGIEIFALVVLIITGKYLKVAFLKVRNAHGVASRTVANLVGGLGESFYSPSHDYAVKKGEVVFDDFLKKQIKANLWDASYYSAAESLYPIILALLAFILPYSKITEAAVVFVIIDLLQRSISPIKDIAGKIANVQRAISSVNRIDQFMIHCDEKIHIDDEIESQYFSNDKTSSSIENFKLQVKSFQYHGRDDFFLQDICMYGKRGESIGIVGLSGSGKSTILKMIAGKILGKEMNITINDDNGNIFHFPGEDDKSIIFYRKQVGLISQDSHVFSASLMFNISFSATYDQKFETFWNWIQSEILYLKNWGLQLDDQIDPAALSLGQKQLLAALRSCYLKKSIVLLDEISSALDGDLEQALRKVILMIQAQSLTIVVAHRLETIMHSDRIYVMDKGRIVEDGNHQQLLETSAIYQDFIKELQ